MEDPDPHGGCGSREVNNTKAGMKPVSDVKTEWKSKVRHFFKLKFIESCLNSENLFETL